MALVKFFVLFSSFQTLESWILDPFFPFVFNSKPETRNPKPETRNCSGLSGFFGFQSKIVNRQFPLS